MAINTVWSIDLGKSSLKAVRLRSSQGNVEIVAVDKVDYPLGDGGEDTAALSREALGIFLARNSVKDPVVVAHPGQGTFSRFIKMPAFDQKKVGEMVGYEASQQIPFPLDEVIWDYHVVNREYLPGEEREVALFAIRRNDVEDFLLEFTNNELAVESVSIGYLGVLNYAAHDLALEEPSIILDIGASHTDLLLMDGDRFWIRAVPHSGNEITRTIQERFHLGFAEAEKLKLALAREPDKAVKIYQSIIQPKLKELVAEVQRSIGAYRSQYGEATFSKLYLLGNGSKIIGAPRFLRESLNMPVEKVQGISHYRVSREANLKLLQANLPAFATALGSAMHILGDAACGVDLVPAEDKMAKVVKRKQKHVFIAAGIILFSMLVSRYLLTSTAQYFSETTQEAVTRMAPLQKGTAAQETYAESRDEFDMLFKQMKESVALRGRVLSALQALDSVLVTFPNARSPSLTVAVKDGAPALGEQMEELLSNRLWVPWARFSRLDDPSAKDSKKGGDVPTEPTYEFKIRVMVKSKDSSEQSVAFIKEKFQAPLEAALKTQGLDIKPAKEGGPLVQIGTIQPNLTEIYFSPSGRDAGTDGGQDGRPFDSVEVSWVLVTRPLETEEDPEEGDEADEEAPEEG